MKDFTMHDRDTERMAVPVLAIKMVPIIAILAVLGGCARWDMTMVSTDAITGPSEFIAKSRDAAEKSMREKNRKRARRMAETGKKYAERCVSIAPDTPGCYYWRAVNTGLFHRVHLVGYQRGIKRMINDCDRVIDLEPSYDNAGAYRILGQIYTKLPQTGGTAESITRDLDLAEKYLREAIHTAPDYPENYVTLAETLLEKDNVEESIAALEKAKELAPHWKTDISYEDWQATMRSLDKKIAKATK